MTTLTIAALIAAMPGAKPQDLLALRQQKAHVFWLARAPWSFSNDLADYLVAEHARQGIPEEWVWSLAYGAANTGLVCRPLGNGCVGPMDCRLGFARSVGVTTYAELSQPRTNIRVHVAEMAYYHDRTGETGVALLARVFYPANPARAGIWREKWRREVRQFSAWWGQWKQKEETTDDGA